ncbi:hypothetical protein PK35_02290 [Tamlana nanhaiensis]|uniref:Secretion system C-terminal sorting domain-containing protein n=1 Tax=Neotamlana nanhaiensis TaxID=1382798 RepID=A0A0D7W7D6_9FLAO|nr:T9SS type A sorting domain-containing protein [Tamlana nanhaiensis]KJD34628.1 hypothetical protein PK35_02290 [Tamlana nanhaiensis]
MKNSYLNSKARYLLKLFVFISCYSYSQDGLLSINAAGHSVDNNSGSISFSIGQVFYASTSNSNFNLNEGVQQMLVPINTSNEDNNSEKVAIDMVIYPNPTTDFVTLKAAGLNFSKLNAYRIFNYQGKLIQESPIKLNETKIDLNYVTSGLYLIQVFVDDQLWNTFKIVKQ